MFSVCKDHVAEQAQSAPLYEQIGSKRNSSDNESEEGPAAKKKRQAHLLNKKTKNTSAESSLTGPGDANMNLLYTTCHLCDLHFTTEVDLEEHIYSLLHHRALEASKGKEFVHECNLCCAKCKGLTLYVAHLREESHKAAVDKRKKETKLKPHTRVYSLVKYRNTFLNEAGKKEKQPPNSSNLPSRGIEKPSSFKQNIFKSTTKKASPKNLFSPTSHHNVPSSKYSGIQRSFQPRPYHERHHSSPFSSNHQEPWQYDHYLEGQGRQWNQSYETGRYPYGPNPYEQWWIGSPHGNPYRYMRRTKPSDTLLQPLFSSPMCNDDQSSKKPAFARDRNNNSGMEKGKLQIGDLESRRKTEPVVFGATKSSVDKPVGDCAAKFSIPQATVKIKPKLDKARKSATSPKPELTTQPPFIKPLKKPNSKNDSIGESTEIYKKFRAVMEEIDHPVFNTNSSATESKVSDSSNLKTEDTVKHIKKGDTQISVPKESAEKFRPRMVTFEEGSKSSLVQSNSESSFQARLCESVLTGDLQEDDTSDESKGIVTVTLDAPCQSTVSKKSKSPKTCMKQLSPKADKTSTNPTKLQTKAKKKKQKKTSDSDTEKQATASAISSQLDALAKKKEAELVDETSAMESLPSSSASSKITNFDDKTNQIDTTESGCQNLSEKRASEMNKKKVSPAPNLSKARSRLSARQRKTSTSDSDTEKKQTRVANILLKLGTRPNTAAEHNLRTFRKPEKRKLSGPRFGIGLVPHEDEPAHHSLDESDLKEIANTIHLVELTPDKLTKRTRSVSVGEPPTLNDSEVSVPVSNQSSTASSQDTNAGSFSQQLLYMSEKEELLHSQGDAIKEEVKKLQDETVQVNSLIEQLLLKKQGLSEEFSKVKQKEVEVNFKLEKIRLQRLALLRGTVANQPQRVTEVPSFHSEACSHSTPTSSISPTQRLSAQEYKPAKKATSFTLPTVPVKTEVLESSKLCTPTKDKTQVVKPAKEAAPFPVASNSEYFDASMRAKMQTVVKRERSPSVDDIMQKYLQQASTDREVTSTTTKPKPLHCSSRKPDDFEVSSTTNSLEDYKRKISNEKQLDKNMFPFSESDKAGTSFAREKKNRISEDPQLAKLDVQRPKSTDATWSWVTAHNETYNSFHADEEKEMQPPGHNMFETMADCTAIHDVHDASVTSVLVTESGWIVTCSKDKTIRVTNAKTGVVVKRFPLPHVPITAHIAMTSDETQDANHEKIFIYVVYLEDGVDRTLLAESTVYRIHLTINLTTQNPECNFRQTKILEYNSSILCLHQSKTSFLYLGARDGRVIVCNYKQVKHVETLDCHSPHAICCLTSGTDGARRILCCGSSDCRISVRDASDGLLLRVFTGHTKTVNSLQLVNNLLYSGSSDRSVLVHNIQTGEVVQKFLGMHGGSIKMLAVHQKAIVTVCLDKCVRVLQSEPCRVSGPPHPTSSLPLSLHLYQTTCRSNNIKVSVPLTCVGCQDGKVQLMPIPQLATHYTQTTISHVPTTTDIQPGSASKTEANFVDYIDLVNSLSCMWTGCTATGFTNCNALLNHIRLFHAPDNYPKQLDSCCLWDNCTLYFSAELDSSKDVRLHMEKHVADAVERSQLEGSLNMGV